jgi:hypothetical protein
MRNRLLSGRRLIVCAAVLAVAGLLGPVVSAEAWPILVGTPGGANNGNCIPFPCEAVFGYDTYLQVYSSSVLGEPVWVIGTTFFNTFGEDGEGNAITSTSYAFGFSTTSASIGGLSETLAGNVGHDSQPYFFGPLGGEIGGPSFTIAGTPFFYRQAPGNLPLQAATMGSSAERQTPAFLTAAADNGLSSPATSSPSQSTGDAGGFLGSFDILAPIPEPATILLVGSGLVAAARSRRRATRRRG